MSISNKLLPKAFAENAGGTYRYDIPYTNDTEFTNKAAYDKGFPAVTMTDIAAGGIPPFGQDMNGILCDLTTAIRYLQAGNLARYDASFANAIGGYLKNAVVSDLDANQYRSLKDNNTAELTDTASWVQIDALEKGIGGTVSGNTNFTGKLQNNGSDVVTKAMNVAYVTETFLSEDGLSWYRVWSDGLIEQGGNIKGNASYSSLLVNLLKPYNSENYSVVVNSLLHSETTKTVWTNYTSTIVFREMARFIGGANINNASSFYVNSYSDAIWCARGMV